MVLVYLPTKLGDFVRANAGVHIPAPWFANLGDGIQSIWLTVIWCYMFIDVTMGYYQLQQDNLDMGMGQYLLIPFLGEWTSIYQLFWCELQGYKVLTHCHMVFPNSNDGFSIAKHIANSALRRQAFTASTCNLGSICTFKRRKRSPEGLTKGQSWSIHGLF